MKKAILSLGISLILLILLGGIIGYPHGKAETTWINLEDYPRLAQIPPESMGKVEVYYNGAVTLWTTDQGERWMRVRINYVVKNLSTRSISSVSFNYALRDTDGEIVDTGLGEIGKTLNVGKWTISTVRNDNILIPPNQISTAWTEGWTFQLKPGGDIADVELMLIGIEFLNN